MRHESIINRILSKILNVKIAVRENLFYETFKGTLDFAPDDIPNMRAVNGAIAGVTSPVYLPYSSGIALPIVLTGFQTLYSGYGRFPKFFAVQNLGTGVFLYLQVNSVATTEVTTGLPDSVSIDVFNDGTNHLQGDIFLIISN